MRHLLPLVLLSWSLWLPGVALAGPPWTRDPGKVWVKVGVDYLRSESRFAHDEERGPFQARDGTAFGPGDRIPYDTTLAFTRFQVAQLVAEANVGLHERIDVTVKVPFVFFARYQHPPADDRQRALGDIRLSTTVNVLRRREWVLGADAELKAPTGPFSVNSNGPPPLGEGQWDLAARAWLGRSWGRVYALGGGGHRARFTNHRVAPAIDVGDEWLAALESGAWVMDDLLVLARYDLLWGQPGEAQDERLAIGTQQPARRYHQLRGALFWRAIRGWGPELSVQVPVAGRNWPADPTWGVAWVGELQLWSPRP